jgi:Zn-finger nucleic acid-binding protein
VPYRQQQYQCPDCRLDLRSQLLRGVSLFACDACSGTWVPLNSFIRLMETSRPQADPDPIIHNDGTERRQCPVCRCPMAIAWVDFLQVDKCEEHGVWCDHGELHQALAGETTPKWVHDLVELSEAEVLRKEKAKNSSA